MSTRVAEAHRHHPCYMTGPSKMRSISKCHLRILQKSLESPILQMLFEDVAKEPGVAGIARSTLEHIFHDCHNIFRHKVTHTPVPSSRYMEGRLAFAHMALHIPLSLQIKCGWRLTLSTGHSMYQEHQYQNSERA